MKLNIYSDIKHIFKKYRFKKIQHRTNINNEIYIKIIKNKKHIVQLKAYIDFYDNTVSFYVSRERRTFTDKFHIFSLERNIFIVYEKDFYNKNFDLLIKRFIEIFKINL